MLPTDSVPHRPPQRGDPITSPSAAAHAAALLNRPHVAQHPRTPPPMKSSTTPATAPDPDDHPGAHSLPHHFRFHLPPHPRTASPFFNPDPEDDDPSRCPAPSVNPATAKTRLEILKSWEVNFTVLSLYTASCIAFLYVLLTLHRTTYTWRYYHDIPPLTAVERFCRFGLACATVVLPLYFVFNLLLAHVITHEQLWTCALLAVGLLATNPLTRNFAAPVAPSRLILTDAIYTATIYLYLLLAAHSYRVLDDRRIHSVKFYASKLAIALTYFIVKLAVGFNAGVSLGLIPFSRVLTWFILAASGRSTLRITVPVLLTTAMDVGFGFWLVRQVSITAEYLTTVPYVDTRAKQLGFRCFVYQTLAFCLSIIGLSLLITIGLPRPYIYFLYDHPHHIFMLEPPVARLGLACVYFTWTLVLAYVNLPAQPYLPFFEHIVPRARHFLARHPRLASWAGLADVSMTADPEDEPSEGDISSASASSASASAPRVHTPVLAKPSSIPMRYRHRELYDETPPHVSISPLTLPPAPAHLQHAFSHVVIPMPDPVLPAPRPQFGRSPSEPTRSSRHIDIPAMHPVMTAALHSPVAPQRRLRMRKNLFVMETQVLLCNAAYLAYIPGNPNEELPRAEMPGALMSPVRNARESWDDLDALDALDALSDTGPDGRKLLYAGSKPEPQAQPEVDDGTTFLVDPHKMALKHDIRIAHHFSDETLNTHAIILLGQSRVIVAFSGTRDMTNWSVNTMAKRAVLDDKLSRFEFEIDGDESDSDDEGDLGSNADSPAASVNAEPVCHGRISHERAHSSGPRHTSPFQCSRDDYPVGEVHWKRTDSPRRSRSTRFDGENESSSLLVRSPDERRNRSQIDFRRSRSVDRVTFLAQRHDLQSERLVDEDADRALYGTMDRPTMDRPTWDPRRRMRHPAAWDDLMVMQRRGGMSMVASAMARELMTFGKPKVHEGFLKAYLSLRKRVLGALMELYGGDSNACEQRRRGENWGAARGMPLFFTGHSLGGAMAQFGAYEAARYYRRVGIARRQDVSCTTFGCPRVGNEAFKMRYERLVETHWRFEFASDPIPRVLTSILNYVPVGVQVLIDQSGMLLIDPSLIEVQWWAGLSNPYLGYKLHIRASYCMGLRTYCRRYRDGGDSLEARFWEFPLRYQTRGLFGHN